MAARLLAGPAVWGEELLISGDIYSDPNEYCVDHTGIALGDALAEVLLNRQIKAVTNYANEWLNEKTAIKKIAPYAERYCIRVKCPVNTTITDRSSGKSLTFDQKSQSIAGNLPASLYMEKEGNYLLLAAYIPAENLDIRCEAIADGKFTLECWNLNTNNGESFEDIKIVAGEVLELTVIKGQADQLLISSTGAKYKVQSIAVSDTEAKALRTDARDYVLEQVRIRSQNNQTGSTIRIQSGAAATWIIVILLVSLVAHLALLAAVLFVPSRLSAETKSQRRHSQR